MSPTSRTAVAPSPDRAVEEVSVRPLLQQVGEIAELQKRFESIRHMLRTTVDSAPPRPSSRPQTKYEALVAEQRLTREQLGAAEREAKQREVDVESILMARHGIPKAVIGAALSRFYGCPFVAYDETHMIPPELLQGVKLSYARQSGWIPLARDGDVVTVLIDDPYDLHKVDGVERVLDRRKVRLAVGLRDDILAFIDAVEGKGRKDAIASMLEDLSAEVEVPATPEVVPTEVSENDSAIIRLANQVLLDAHAAGASDVHIEPAGAGKPTIIRFRVDGTCFDYQEIPAGFRQPLIARFKIMANLDIAERRLPQDGKMKIRMPERDLEVRIATIPTVAGEDIVMRLLSAGDAIPLDKLALHERNLQALRAMVQRPHGLILCVGPTGSGKTTTLHSLLAQINTRDRKIWTAEDPVEIMQPGLRQLQVRPKIGLTFTTAMRAFLRGDPDVIMLGEMRDRETGAIGLEASLTGHLVLTTLHTNSAVETVIRLLDLGLDPFNFADALLGILAQRLVKRICERCREPHQASLEELDELRRHYRPDDADALGLREGLLLYAGRGCRHCNQTGFRGRLGIHELLVASDELKRLIQSRARVTDILGCARAEGMTTLLEDGVRKVLEGNTTFMQVKAVAIR